VAAHAGVLEHAPALFAVQRRSGQVVGHAEWYPVGAVELRPWQTGERDRSMIAGDVVARLRVAGCVFAEAEAALLTEQAKDAAELDAMVDRRAAGEPIEHVLGWAEFCGLRIAVQPGVFVPRVRTEFLTRTAVAVTPPGAVAVDLCCGSGAMGLALATAVRVAELHCVDVDPAAVRCAARNVAAVGGVVYRGNLYQPLPDSLRGRIDVIVANVPYVPSDEVALLPAEARLHEARVALDGGADGLDVLRQVARGASGWLAPGGHLLIETSERQAPVAAAGFAECGLDTRLASSVEFDVTVVIGQVTAGEHETL
jgi:release factor glutamine methyltransferase